MIAMSLIQALMYENLHEESTMMRSEVLKKITWLSGKSIGSYLGGTRFKTLLAPLDMPLGPNIIFKCLCDVHTSHVHMFHSTC